MSTENKKPHFTSDSSDRVSVDEYDPHIVPAETAARKEREGNTYKTVPTEAKTDDRTDSESLHTTDGYTVDKEGLLNNYAIEPEMYVNEPGDLRAKEAELAAQRSGEIKELKDDEKGKLTMEKDERHRGQGVI